MKSKTFKFISLVVSIAFSFNQSGLAFQNLPSGNLTQVMDSKGSEGKVTGTFLGDRQIQMKTIDRKNQPIYFMYAPESVSFRKMLQHRINV